MKLKSLILLLPLLALLLSFAPGPEQPLVQWYDLDTAVRRAKAENKKVWVHVYTDWCAWCKVMDKQAFSDPKILDYLQRKYIPVRLNAWDKSTLTFDGQTFDWLPQQQCNALAYSLLDGKMEYPTTVILSGEAEILSPVKGYLDKSTAKKLMVFFGENMHLRMAWEDFKKKYEY